MIPVILPPAPLPFALTYDIGKTFDLGTSGSQRSRDTVAGTQPILATNASAASMGIFTRAIEQVARLALLPANWDGHDGMAPTAAAIVDAQTIIKALPYFVQAPTAEPSGDGEVNLVWRSAERYVEVGTYGDGSISYFAKSRTDPNDRQHGDFPAGQPLPPALLAQLSRFENAAVRM